MLAGGPAKETRGAEAKGGQTRVVAVAAKISWNWNQVQGVTVRLKPAIKNCDQGHLGAVDATIKAQYSGDSIAIQVSWPDTTKNDTHKSKVWDEKLKAYRTAKDREDRVALMFEMGGDFSSCMLAGKVFRTDVWHWKAARTAPAGLAHDKRHIYSLKPVHKKSKEFVNRHGKVYIARVSDAGDAIAVATKPPAAKTKDKLPGFVLNPKAQGSIADVKAEASHDGKRWTVTMIRKLDTGHDDDVVFKKGRSYRAAVACFDHSVDMHHSTAGFILVVE